MAGSMTMAMMAAGAGASMVAESQAQKKVAKQNRQYYDEQKRALNRQRETAVRDQERRLTQAQAKHRARMAASGVSPDDGSSGALLDGLEDATQDVINAREADYNEAVSRLESRAASNTDKSIAPTTETTRDHLGGTNSILSALKIWG